jgi:hypothetical protein
LVLAAVASWNSIHRAADDRAKLARNYGSNVMDEGGLYHVTFLRLASLKLRASPCKIGKIASESARLCS